MTFGIDKRKIAGFLTAFFLLLVSYFLLFYNTNEMIKQSRLVDHTNMVILNLEYLVSELKDAESNFRGYIIMNNNDSLKDKFYISAARTDSLYKYVRSLSSDNPAQSIRMDSLKNALEYKLGYMRTGLEAFDKKKELKDSLLSLFYTGSHVAVVRKTVKRMQYYENALLEQRTEELNNFTTSIKIINITALVLAFVTVIYSVGTYTKENQARRIADEKADKYKTELEMKVNELKIANRELTELKTIEKFAASGRIARTIAHEVRNPLTNIGLAVEQLKDLFPENEDSELLLDMINRNGTRINKLISDLLNATKFSELKFQQLPLHLILDQALEMAKDRIELNGVTVQKDYHSGVESIVEVDDEKIKIAFLNIIVNAIESMENGKGILKVSTQLLGRSCKIQFTDNGTGMNEETQSKLFEPFFTNKEKGTGLGLTNTQNIILNHKGKIDVESQAGKGTSFTITLNTV